MTKLGPWISCSVFYLLEMMSIISPRLSFLIHLVRRNRQILLNSGDTAMKSVERSDMEHFSKDCDDNAIIRSPVVLNLEADPPCKKAKTAFDGGSKLGTSSITLKSGKNQRFKEELSKGTNFEIIISYLD